MAADPQPVVDEPATDPVADAPDGAAGPTGGDDGEVVLELTPVPIPVDPLTSDRWPDETFLLAGLEAYGEHWLALGTVQVRGGVPEPAIYRTPFDDLASWAPLPLELPDGYPRGEMQIVDSPRRQVATIQREDGQRHAWLLGPTGNHVAVLDDSPWVRVANVVDAPVGDLVLGSRYDEDGARSAAAWYVNRNREVTAVDLPEAPALRGGDARLTAGTVLDEDFLVFGVDGEEDELLVLRGPAHDALQVVERPDGLPAAARIYTVTEVDGVWWAGGSLRSDDDGPGLWSSTDGETWRSRVEEVQERIARDFDEAVTGLRGGSWRYRGVDVTATPTVLSSAGMPAIWHVEGDEITNVWSFGGDRAALGRNHTLFHSRRHDDWVHGTIETAEEVTVGGLPPSGRRADTPGAVGIDVGRMVVATGHDGEGDTVVLSREDGAVLLVAEGQLRPGTVDGPDLMVGYHRDDDYVPRIMERDDGAWVTHELPVADDVVTARLFEVLDADGTPTVLGHQWAEGSELRPLVYQPAEGGGWEEVELPGTDPGRGFLRRCGEVYVTYDADFVLGLARWVDGRFEEQIFEDLTVRGNVDCAQDGEGRIWRTTEDGSVYRIDLDGGRERVESPVTGGATIGVADIAGREHLWLLAQPTPWATTWAGWIRPVDGGDWRGGGVVHELTGAEEVARPSEGAYLAGRQNREPKLWEVTIRSP